MKKGEYLTGEKQKYIIKVDGIVKKTRFSKAKFGTAIIIWEDEEENGIIVKRYFFTRFSGTNYTRFDSTNRKMCFAPFINNVANINTKHYFENNKEIK
jgi:hypothetical protein